MGGAQDGSRAHEDCEEGLAPDHREVLQPLTLDFHVNKRVTDDVAIVQSKRVRNKIAGFTTHLMKRIQRGPVRGISLKLQEEERERRMDFVPEESAISVERIEVDKDTMDMLRSIQMAGLPGVALKTGFSRPGAK